MSGVAVVHLGDKVQRWARPDEHAPRTIDLLVRGEGEPPCPGAIPVKRVHFDLVGGAMVVNGQWSGIYHPRSPV